MDAILSALRQRTTPGQRRFFKFCLVGASGVPVNLLLAWVGYSFLFAALAGAWRDAASFLLGIGVSIFTNFLLNDLWTWGDRPVGGPSMVRRLGRFYLVCAGASAIQFGVAMGLVVWLGVHPSLAQLLGIGLATLINFALNNLWTFSSSTGQPAPADSADEHC